MPFEDFLKVMREEPFSAVAIPLFVAFFLFLFGYFIKVKIAPLLAKKYYNKSGWAQLKMTGAVLLLCLGVAKQDVTLILLAIVAGVFVFFSKGFQQTTATIQDAAQDPESLYTIDSPDLHQKYSHIRSKGLVYKGSEIEYPEDIMQGILTKYFPFYKSLETSDKGKFILRLRQFIAGKNFVIHDESGFREMPVLVSAAAVQLSFGLQKFMLPSFHTINIYPAEFIRTTPSITFLIGNVSNNCINISWAHFLSGFATPDNGENVGLHEMAHAYYYQNFATDIDGDEKFKSQYPDFDVCCNRAYLDETLSSQKFFTAYGLTNMQEFWAESVELFFEKPLAMQQHNQSLYYGMCTLLNLYPHKKLFSAV